MFPWHLETRLLLQSRLESDCKARKIRWCKIWVLIWFWWREKSTVMKNSVVMKFENLCEIIWWNYRACVRCPVNPTYSRENATIPAENASIPAKIHPFPQKIHPFPENGTIPGFSAPNRNPVPKGTFLICQNSVFFNYLMNHSSIESQRWCASYFTLFYIGKCKNIM